MKIPREDLLSQLESVEPGLSNKDIIEQGRHFIFLKDRIVTFNDQISCTMATTLDIRGAVRAQNFLGMLRQMREEDVEVVQNSKTITLKGKNKRTRIYVDKEIEILKHIETIEKPTKWKSLPEEFCEAIEITAACVSKKASDYTSTCVHLHPDYLEASDNVQVTRYPLKLKLKRPILIVGECLKHVAEAEVTHFSQGNSWIHFRNPRGLIISCRLSSDEDYPDLSGSFDVSGKKAVLPKGLVEAAKRAQMFSSENVEKDRVIISLRPGRMLIKGEGISGDHKEGRKINYKGHEIEFLISPSILIDIVTRHNECKISEDFLKIDTGSYVYVTCLGHRAKKKKKGGD